jgi:hypothetical protein
MTKQADFKRRVRARMARTGESYTTARTRLLPPPTETDLAEALHVSNGDATDLAGTGLAHRILYRRDTLHEGPVPAVGPERLRQIRATFLAQSNMDEEARLAKMLAERDRTLESNRDGEYVLWFEADLYDQLQIIEILARLAAFVRGAARETRPYLGDGWCFAMMDRLAAAPEPLLAVEPAGRPVDRHTRLRLTGTGARVLAGEADHVSLGGVDRWIGGVHLHGDRVRWRWDDGTETVAEVSEGRR